MPTGPGAGSVATRNVLSPYMYMYSHLAFPLSVPDLGVAASFALTFSTVRSAPLALLALVTLVALTFLPGVFSALPLSPAAGTAVDAGALAHEAHDMESSAAAASSRSSSAGNVGLAELDGCSDSSST